MTEYERVPITSQTARQKWRDLYDQILKAAAAGEGLRLPVLPVSAPVLRASLSRWAGTKGYCVHLQKQPDGAWIVWMEPTE